MLLPVSFFLAGLIFGSFGSVLITRVPRNEKITGRSKCPQCKTTLSALGLIPLVSFCLSRGKCRTCNKPIGMFYPFVELASGALFLLAFYLNRDIASSAFMAMALWLLFIISVIDIRTKTISDALSIPLCIFGMLYSWEIGGFFFGGALLGIGFFGGLWAVSKGKFIGSGDILLGAGIGFLVGSWQMMMVCIMATYIIGALVASTLLISGKMHRKSTIPFAQFLALGALFVIVFHDRLAVALSIYF
jgi:prepilin signal peptidase PulO-like enzyme (type II secretory pathway)